MLAAIGVTELLHWNWSFSASAANKNYAEMSFGSFRSFKKKQSPQVLGVKLPKLAGSVS